MTKLHNASNVANCMSIIIVVINDICRAQIQNAAIVLSQQLACGAPAMSFT